MLVDIFLIPYLLVKRWQCINNIMCTLTFKLPRKIILCQFPKRILIDNTNKFKPISIIYNIDKRNSNKYYRTNFFEYQSTCRTVRLDSISLQLFYLIGQFLLYALKKRWEIRKVFFSIIYLVLLFFFFFHFIFTWKSKRIDTK